VTYSGVCQAGEWILEAQAGKPVEAVKPGSLCNAEFFKLPDIVLAKRI